MRAAALFFLTALSPSPASSFHLNALFTDGLVLQTGSATVFGTGAPGEAVTVERAFPSGASDRFSGAADAAGLFVVRLADPAAGEAAANISLVVSNATASVRIGDVAYGDVLVCSGQSNMFISVSMTFDANQTMAGVWPNLRLFAVTTGWAADEQADFPPPFNKTTEAGACGIFVPNSKQRCLTWQTATQPTVIGAFSATCFYTAINLAKRLPADAVFGLVHSSFVGTDMQTWSPPEAIAECKLPPNAAPPRDPIPTGFSSLWNAMIHPIVHFGIRGVLWNQGEANMGWSESDFGCLFQAMIAAWRARWEQPAGFFWGFVQLGTQPPLAFPSYLDGSRLGQSDALPGHSHTNRSAMAVAYDVGDHTGVHARNKSAIGQRLAAALLHVEWGMDLPALDWAPPSLVSAALGADGDVTFTFATADGRGIFLNDTRDCWDCCARGRDSFELYNVTRGAVRAAHVNTTLRLGPSVGGVVSSVIATPAEAGAFTGATFARGLWPQCAVFGLGNALPAEPFNVNLTAFSP